MYSIYMDLGHLSSHFYSTAHDLATLSSIIMFICCNIQNRNNNTDTGWLGGEGLHSAKYQKIIFSKVNLSWVLILRICDKRALL